MKTKDFERLKKLLQACDSSNMVPLSMLKGFCRTQSSFLYTGITKSNWFRGFKSQSRLVQRKRFTPKIKFEPTRQIGYENIYETKKTTVELHKLTIS